jgi:uncharacterized membrane protein
MNPVFSTKRLCRAGVIASLYVVLTYAFSAFAFGPFQVRPAEALCLLPLFFPEAIPALTIGCLLSNILSQYTIYDMIFGSLATLIAAYGTYFIGKTVKNTPLKLFLGGLFPVLLNAIIIPLIILFLAGSGATFSAYLVMVLIFLFTQTVWVYGLGIPLYFSVLRIQKKFKL